MADYIDRIAGTQIGIPANHVFLNNTGKTVTEGISDINKEIGDGFSSTSTIANSIKNINDKIGDVFSSTNTVASNISANTNKIGDKDTPNTILYRLSTDEDNISGLSKKINNGFVIDTGDITLTNGTLELNSNDTNLKSKGSISVSSTTNTGSLSVGDDGSILKANSDEIVLNANSTVVNVGENITINQNNTGIVAINPSSDDDSAPSVNIGGVTNLLGGLTSSGYSVVVGRTKTQLVSDIFTSVNEEYKYGNIANFYVSLSPTNEVYQDTNAGVYSLVGEKIDNEKSLQFSDVIYSSCELVLDTGGYQDVLRGTDSFSMVFEDNYYSQFQTSILYGKDLTAPKMTCHICWMIIGKFDQ